MPAVGEGAEGAGAHGVDNHNVPDTREQSESVFKLQTEPGFILTV